MSDIFISYKREEQATARKLADALEKEGWSVWWDPKLRAGEHFDDVIEKALMDAKCVIVLWSKLSVESRYVKDEAGYALKRSKLVPVAIDDVEPPFRFEGLHTERLGSWDGSDTAPELKKLVADIADIVREPSTEASKVSRKQSVVDPKIFTALMSEKMAKITSAYLRIEDKRREAYVSGLVHKLESPSSQERLAALMALFVIKYKHLIVQLIMKAKDESSAVRRLAVSYLGELKARNGVAVVSELLSDGSPHVRAAARDAYQKITGHRT